VSYARGNKPVVDQLVDHLGVVGYQAWVDSSLRGDQDWWEEILGRITDRGRCSHPPRVRSACWTRVSR
jgi:hypothetical protein